MLLLLETLVEKCQKENNILLQKLSTIDDSLHPTHEKMVSILRSISACNTKSKVRGIDWKGGVCPDAE